MAKETVLEKVAQHLTGKHITLTDRDGYKLISNEKVVKAVAVATKKRIYFYLTPNETRWNWSTYTIGHGQHIINHDCEKDLPSKYSPSSTLPPKVAVNRYPLPSEY